MNKTHLSLYFLLALIFFSSCSKRNLTYFSDLPAQTIYQDSIINATQPKIQPDDLLGITVTSLNPEANALFNNGSIPLGGSMVNNSAANHSTSNITNNGYLVDQEGNIDLPVLGKVKVGEMTTAAAKDFLSIKLEQYLKEPMVNLRLLNFNVTVVGEVSNPSTFTIPSEKINLLEALGMAGDMTPFGKRDNVLVIREEKGKRTLARLNLNSKDVLQSPYFYLQQNDVVYVEPNNARAAQASTTRSNISIILSAASVISIILTRLF